MHRRTLAVVVPLLWLVGSSPGYAATIVQDITGLSQSLGDFTPFDINAMLFNPADGTLQSVTVEMIGTYTPMTANDLGPFPSTTTLTTHLFVFPTNGPPSDNQTVVLGSQSNVPVTVSGPGAAGIATGMPESVDQLFNFPDLAAFESGSEMPLVEYGFRTANTLSGAGGASDLSSFSGQAIITYTYEVPEPATVLMVGIGLLGLALTRRQRV